MAGTYRPLLSSLLGDRGMESDTRRSSGQVLSEALLASNAVTSEGESKGETQDVSWRQNNPDHASGLPSPGLISALSTGSAAALSTGAGPREGDPNPYDFPADGSIPDMAVREGLCKSFKGGRRSTSVTTLLRQLAAGNTLRGEAWKLTRAVVHVEDAWKGKVSPCPPLEEMGLRRLFKLRWKYRGVDFWLIHLLLVLCLLEIPAWCMQGRECFWACYPDFTRDWHMEIWLSLLLEGTMLTALVVMALVDVVRDDFALHVRFMMIHAGLFVSPAVRYLVISLQFITLGLDAFIFFKYLQGL